MERNNKKLIIITILILILTITGCDKMNLSFITSDNQNSVVNDNDKAKDKAKDNANDVTDKSKENSKDKQKVTQTPNSQQNNLTDDGGPKPTEIEPLKSSQISIYSINNETGNIESVTALVPAGSSITPQLIVDLVVDAMADQSMMVGVENVSTKEDAVIVSFYANKPPSANVGSGIENAILDAFAFSLIDNIKQYKKVIYRIEGKAYISGHNEYELDEVYLGNN